MDLDEWELYQMVGSDQAVQYLSRALTLKIREAQQMLRENDLLCRKKIARKIQNEMYSIMDKWSNYGAADLEAHEALRVEVETALGLEGYALA